MQESNYLMAYAKCKQRVAYLERHLEALISKHEREVEKLKSELINPAIDWKKPQPRNLARLIQAVCVVCDLTPGQLISPTRRRELVTARHLFYYVGRHHMKQPWARLGSFLTRDHSTAIWGSAQYENYLKMGYKVETQMYYDLMAELGDEVGIVEEVDLTEIQGGNK
jgi:chromosomal replication initiation ATPase DnaA